MKSAFFVIIATISIMSTIPSCKEKGAKPCELPIENALTDAEKAAGKFTAEVMWKMGRIAEPRLSPDGKTVSFTLTYYNMEQNKGVSSIYTMASGGGAITQITDNCGKEWGVKWSDDSRTLYFLSNRSGEAQLWTIPAEGGEMRQLSYIEDGIDAFGISQPSKKIWYTKRVKVGVTKDDLYPDMDKSSAMIYSDLMVRHWDTWCDGNYSHIFVADFDGESIANARDIMANEEWDAPLAPYFDDSEIAWSNRGDLLAYTCKKLKGKEYALSTNSDIYVYSVSNGITKNITQGMPGYDKYPTFSPNDSRIAFTSMARAGNESDKTRLMVYDFATEKVTYITEKFDYNAENVVWTGADEVAFISPIKATHQICRANILTAEVAPITQGWHDYTALSVQSGRAVATMTTLSRAAEIYGVDLANGKSTQLTNINKEIYDNIKMGEVRQRMIRTTDGKEMLTWVVLPPDFDSTKRYPALLYCQGGPQSVVSQFWSYRWNFQLMAAQGYIVVAPNRRGLPSFGQEWLDQISGDYSGQNIKDYLSAIDNVSAESWCDKDRLGCVGASYGGYSVYYLAGHHKKRFKAFISHCGMFNFDSFYCSTEELWFPQNDFGGTPWSTDYTARRSYANSPHKFITKWDTPILIFSGLNDFRIPYTESLQAFTSAQLLGVPSRLVAFPDEAHQVFKPQNSIVWNREFFGWLDKYLK